MVGPVNTLLRAFNPNPLNFHVAPAGVLETERTSSNAQTIMESSGGCTFFLLPLYLVDTAHWALVVIRDRKRDYCGVFHTLGPPTSAESFQPLVALLAEQGFLRAGQSANLDLFPEIRQKRDADGIVLLAAVALHTLHEKPGRTLGRVPAWLSLLSG